MMRLAITLVCLALAVAANGESLAGRSDDDLPTDAESPSTDLESLFPDITHSEEISGEQLKEKLLAANIKDNIGWRNITELLFATKDKDSAEICNGLTAAALIKQAYINVDGCSKDALRARVDLFDAVNTIYLGDDGKTFVNRLNFFVALYIMGTINEAAKYCLEHVEEAIAKGINDKKYMKGLRKANSRDIGQGEDMLVAHVSYGGSNVVRFIRLGHNGLFLHIIE
jgi:hypothetical protein